MILVLATERGLMKGLGYVLGWLFTLVAIVALTVLVTGGKPLIPKSNPSTAALAVKLAIGVVLVWIAYRRWGKWQTSEPKGQPRWMAGIDRINPLTAAGPRLPAAALGPGDGRRGRPSPQAKISSTAEYIALFAFCLLVLGELPGHGDLRRAAPGHGQEQAGRAPQWITSHRDQVIVFLSLGLGLYLMAKSIYGLVQGD